jgi:NIMA (never in mitosis gene a)-related kinase
MSTEEMEGREVEGYRVIKPIGSGKFSIVYKAERIADGLQVALKLIKIFDVVDPKQREKCLKEVRLLQSLDHPHIIKYLNSFIVDNELLIAIEWAERGDLKRVIKRAQAEESVIEETRIWEYLIQMAGALQHMHERRIMHRDLKPANILISADGSLKLGDLGLGRSLSSQTLEAYSRVGTPLYMSPEVLKSNGYDWKSDVWSLGCIVYELAALRSPFKSDDEKMSLYDLFQTINKGQYPPLPDRYSAELRGLVDSMLLLDPVQRAPISDVTTACEAHMNSSSRAPKIDSALIMEDIIEKLRLLDYENRFCMPYRRKPISRVYFNISINPAEQLAYFYELSHWLMSLSKTGKRRSTEDGLNEPMPLGPVLDMNSIGDPLEVAKQVLTDVRAIGMRIPESVTPGSLKEGNGEGVCFIINDLSTRELIRQNFCFLQPIVSEGGVNVYGQTESADEVAEEIEGQSELEVLAQYAPDVGEDEKTMEHLDLQVTSKSTNELYQSFQKQQLVQSDHSELETGIIESSVNPEDWLAELRRVEPALDLTSEELSAASEDWKYRVQQMSYCLRGFQANTQEQSIHAWEQMTHNLTDQLTLISRGEARIRSQNAESLAELSHTLADKKEVTAALTVLRDKVSAQCNEFDELKESEAVLLKELKVLSGQLDDDSALTELKTGLTTLKREARDLELKGAVAAYWLDQKRSRQKVGGETVSFIV